MPDRQRLTIALDSLELRLAAMLDAAPVDALFWHRFDRKRMAIEVSAVRADVEFVRDRISSMLAAQQLVPGVPGAHH